MAKFKEIDPKLNLANQELKVLEFWDKENIFEKSLDLRKKGKRFVFFEGPPTANAKPGLHHLISRYFKDLWPRFKTMQGFFVERKAGWDTHGLPVEISVEKELGLKNKQDIEKYGIAKFNQKAKENVWKYKELWEEFTKRSAFWLDLDNPYISHDPKYIESLWWIIRQAWDKKLLYQGYKVVPYCTRCGTALSSHEVAQGYKEVEENSIYIKFKLKDKENTYILAWTTTPWTLPGNVALAVGSDINYIKATIKKIDSNLNEINIKIGETYIFANEVNIQSNIFGDIFHPISDVADYNEVDIWIQKKDGSKAHVLFDSVEIVKGKDLIGKEYEPLFDGAIPKTAENFDNAFKIYPAEFVTTEDGTGIVHIAVMYGEDDYKLGDKVGLPKVHTVSPEGLFLSSVKKWAGKYVKDSAVEKGIIQDLKDRNLLFKEMPYKHDYPFCWRCASPLLYYAMDSWFIKMSALQKQLLANNKTINWIPKHLQEGRFGEWLRGIKDWAISRSRYWGTPLPIWKSDSDKIICVGSFKELKKLTKNPIKDDFDPHKPDIDEIILLKDGEEYRRVPDVIDTWFDSGSMPFAQWHYPFENKDRIDKGLSFPADFIAEAVDQTRGWFYTLLAVSTVLDKGAPYKNVISLGHVLDKHGKKMSKSKGNVVDPWMIFKKYGSDVLRWYFYTVNQPGLPKNFDEDILKQINRRFILTLWNTLSFFVTYANLDNFCPENKKPKPDNVLDKWILTNLAQTIYIVTNSLEQYDVISATSAIELLINDLSNWYIRRSRKRFWKSKDDKDKLQAYQTLYWVLKNISLILAPFMPMTAEIIYDVLKQDKDPISVHLNNWPSLDKDNRDQKVMDNMNQARKIVELGHNLREEAKIKVRQPLSKIVVTYKPLTDDLVALIKDELNIKTIEFEAKKNKLDIKITSELEMEGLAREIIRAVQSLRKNSGLEVSDRIKLYYDSLDNVVIKTFSNFADYIQTEVLAIQLTKNSDKASEKININNKELNIGLEKNE